MRVTSGFRYKVEVWVRVRVLVEVAVTLMVRFMATG